MSEYATCSRPGCAKKLRRTNTTGQCATGCLSPEAPPAKRAKGTKSASSAPRRPADVQQTSEAAPTDALARFRLVATALKKDPDEVLNEFAQAWLDGLAAKLNEEG